MTHASALPRPRWGLGLTLLFVGLLVAVPTWLGLFAGSTPVGSFFGNLFKLYMPRQTCMYHEPLVIWLHILSDSVIALAYYSIPVALLYLVRQRADLGFSWIYVCFAIFILACGTTHVMNILAMWYAVYRVDGLLKFFTAAASISTAFLLWALMPTLKAIPSPGALRVANDELGREIEVRRRAEASLLAMQGELERRVRERTAELRIANDRLLAEAAARSVAEQEREQLLVSERSARTEAERANRMKDDFLATLSHELRTPLNAITGWVHLLRQAHGHIPALNDGLTIIDRNTRIQTDLIEDLLDMSRIASGKLGLDLKSVDLRRVIEAAVETVTPAASAREVKLVQDCAPGLPPVTGDPARLQQVVWNLLSNAIKFTPKGGRVEIRLAAVESHLEITVADSGHGIAADFLPNVFDRFRQADASTTRQHGGLGLGLAIVRHLVELHGGTVRADSPGVDQGATFTVQLPARALTGNLSGQYGGPAVSALRLLAHHLEGMRIVVVDDETDTREVLRRILEQSGAAVYAAANAAEALELVRRERPTALLSDIGMPGEDGYTLIKQIRQLAPEAGGLTPAVALTAFARPEDRMRVMAAGFQVHIAKPAEPSELILVLGGLASRIRANDVRPS